MYPFKLYRSQQANFLFPFQVWHFLGFSTNRYLQLLLSHQQKKSGWYRGKSFYSDENIHKHSFKKKTFFSAYLLRRGGGGGKGGRVGKPGRDKNLGLVAIASFKDDFCQAKKGISDFLKKKLQVSLSRIGNTLTSLRKKKYGSGLLFFFSNGFRPKKKKTILVCEETLHISKMWGRGGNGAHLCETQQGSFKTESVTKRSKSLQPFPFFPFPLHLVSVHKTSSSKNVLFFLFFYHTHATS